MRTSLVLGLALAVPAAAQIPNPPSVPETIHNSGNVALPTGNNFDVRVCAPKEILPADPANGLAATPNVVYTAFRDAQFNPMNPLLSTPGIAFRRSVDGGVTFEPASFPFLGPFRSRNQGGRFWDMRCEGHEVYILLESSLTDPTDPMSSDGVNRLYLCGSQDQGQTWQIVQIDTGVDAPLSTGDRFSEVDDPPSFDVADGRVHIAFNARFSDSTGNLLGNAVGLPGPTGAEDNYYQAAQFTPAGNLVRVFPEERSVENVPSGTFDSDDPWCRADSLTVCVAYQNVSGGGDNGTGNDTYSVVSPDGGISLTAPFNHTNFMGQGSSLDFNTRCDVVGTQVVVTAEYNQNGGPGGAFADQAFYSYSPDQGQTWPVVQQLGYSAPWDLDRHRVRFVGDDQLWFAAEDQGTLTGGAGNDDEIYSQIGPIADFNAGVFPPIVPVSRGLNTGQIELYDIDYVQIPVNVPGGGQGLKTQLVVGFEAQPFGPEGWSFGISTDGGTSFTVFDADDDADGDVDHGDVAMTMNGDVVSLHIEDEINGNNAVFQTKQKAQYIVDNSATTLSVDYFGGNPGDLAILLVSENTAGGIFALPPATNPLTGVQYNFTPGQVTIDTLGSLLFLSTVGPDGQTSFFFADFATILGQDLALMVGTINAPGGEWNRCFTEQLIQKP